MRLSGGLTELPAPMEKMRPKGLAVACVSSLYAGWYS
jgi:hypothetical protein